MITHLRVFNYIVRPCNTLLEIWVEVARGLPFGCRSQANGWAGHYHEHYSQALARYVVRPSKASGEIAGIRRDGAVVLPSEGKFDQKVPTRRKFGGRTAESFNLTGQAKDIYRGAHIVPGC